MTIKGDRPRALTNWNKYRGNYDGINFSNNKNKHYRKPVVPTKKKEKNELH